MSAFDLPARGGELLDGTGAPRRRADLGIRHGRVVAIADLDTGASAVIDADRLVVAPGIVDIHMHFEAQVLWDLRRLGRDGSPKRGGPGPHRLELRSHRRQLSIRNKAGTRPPAFVTNP